MSIDEETFRTVMGHFATGVTVVTTAAAGQLSGLTVSSFTSLSLEPPLILVCIATHADSHPLLIEAGQFAVNILAADQTHLSLRFANPDAEKFIPGSYTLSERGLPWLNGALAVLECRITERFPGGDHSIFIGDVVQTRIHTGEPLLYYRTGYYRLGETSLPQEPHK